MTLKMGGVKLTMSSGKPEVRASKWTLLALIWLCLAGWGFAAGLKGKVVKVSDGDTIWVRLDNGNRVKVRVWGIDTPEKFRSKKLFREARRCGVEPAAIVHLGKLAPRQAEELLDHSGVDALFNLSCEDGGLACSSS